ncbi:MAG: PQQ-binding-like beta-propeller repeat protein [Planctomycetota bacterium]
MHDDVLDEHVAASDDHDLRQVVAVDKANGEMLWSKSIAPRLPESRYSKGNDSRHGYASSTPTSDGERLYVFLGKTGVLCFDLDGQEIWRSEVGDGTHGWGSGTSPLLVDNLVIVNASIESEALIALDKRTGDRVWTYPDVERCWTSPVLVETAEGPEVVLSMPNKIVGIDPGGGDELWHCEGIPDRYVCPSPIVHDGVAYVIGGRKNTAIAVKAGGRGDVTDSHVLWRVDRGSNVASPVYLDGYLYWLHESRGIAYCLDAETGDVQYQQRLDPRPGLIYGSLTAADGKLYALSQDNGAYVLAATPAELQQLAVNRFESDPSRCNACAAVVDGRIYLRTDQALYCLGAP